MIPGVSGFIGNTANIDTFSEFRTGEYVGKTWKGYISAQTPYNPDNGKGYAVTSVKT